MAPRLLHYSDLENAYDRPERVARLAGLLRRERDDRTLVAGTGDNTGPGALPLVTEGEQAIPFFEAVRPDVETFGNHDFDHGPARAAELAASSPQPWVSANVRDDGERFATDAGVVPHRVVPVGDETVGFVGLCEPKTADLSPGASSLTFEDPAAALERELPRLREAGADHVVVLAHVGDSEPLAAEFDVDAVLAGHVHDQAVRDVAGVPFSRTGANGRVVHAVDLADGSVTVHEVGTAPVAADVRDALAERKAAAGLDETVASLEDPLYRDNERRRGGEFRVGNFIADAFRWAGDADAALCNTGGIREGPPLSGRVTVEDFVSLLPFDEPVAVAEVTGRELEALAHEADGARQPGVHDHWMAHVSGMAIRRNGDGYEVHVDGERVDPDRTYSLATSDYLLVADHEFPTLTEAHRERTLSVQYEVLADYAREHGVWAPLEGRVPTSAADGRD